MSRRANPTNSVMMNCITCLFPPNINQTFNLHHVDYLILTKFYPTFGYSPYTTGYPKLGIKQRLSPAKEATGLFILLTNKFPYKTILPYASNFHGQHQEGKIIKQQQTEMNPPNPPHVGIDQVVAA
jgi:hypothetical protein